MVETGTAGWSVRMLAVLTRLLGLLVFTIPLCGASAEESSPRLAMPRVRVSDDGASFVLAQSGQPFVPWGFNYLGQHGRLAEEDWDSPAGWERVETDFREMRKLGANVVRWHLQFETYMEGPDSPRTDQLAHLGRLVDLAGQTGLYLDITGLNCYRKERITSWYDELPETDRWRAQSRFWAEVAKACAGNPAVFCFDLMNEPVRGCSTWTA